MPAVEICNAGCIWALPCVLMRFLGVRTYNLGCGTSMTLLLSFRGVEVEAGMEAVITEAVAAAEGEVLLPVVQWARVPACGETSSTA